MDAICDSKRFTKLRSNKLTLADYIYRYYSSPISQRHAANTSPTNTTTDLLKKDKTGQVLNTPDRPNQTQGRGYSEFIISSARQDNATDTTQGVVPKAPLSSPVEIFSPRQYIIQDNSNKGTLKVSVQQNVAAHDTHCREKLSQVFHPQANQWK
jgi:hypothetical protein